ncbi:penicillin-binding protein 1F [Oxobacter pfennigii]|uniref:Penicillin-binding protein 1A n=1 Tax=Oxobacter pfennigii TaxID=36849 RepID=A0A0P8YZM8_9CLOT|nr:PBP1A family penicillin-binding protein [Oxobacter pfennigii]KPU45340.1 penicillin-binding protein 1F [Oxobacter pfennigii]
MNNKQNTDKNRKKKKFKAWKVVLLTIVLAMLVAIGATGGIVLAFINTAPQVNIDNFTNLAQTTKIYDKDGKYIESLHGVENRTYVTLSNIKKYTQDAFIAIEDERFRSHFGVDIRRIFGALWADLKTGRYDQGASTITQQLLKNTVLTSKKEWRRKIQEAYLAIKLEEKLSKDMILEYYLNTIFLGGSANGVQAAAEYYFDKDVNQLTIAESALIAGITQSPSRYNPYLNTDTPEVYKDRASIVLSKMIEHQMISNEEYEEAKAELMAMNETSFKKRSDNTTLKYQWFIEAALSSVEKDLTDKYGYTKDEIQQLIYSGGLRVYTTIDTRIQDIVDRVANDPKFYPHLSEEIAYWGKENIIQPQIGVVITDYKTGQVNAVLGGRGDQPLKSQNRAADPIYARQPGSAMKPLAVYGPAFDMGYSPSSVIDDTPFTPEMKAATGGWEPLNYDRKYSGLTTLRDAVKTSKNVVAAKLMLQIGTGNSVQYLKKFGLSTIVTSGKLNDMGPAISLGGLTKGVIPLEMASAYGVFGNSGVYIEPILYTKVVDSEGNTLLEKNSEKHQVLSSQAAYLTVDVLKGVVNGGTGSKANIGSMPAAGKTGTTNDEADAYFVGLTPYYSGAIWMGHDKPSIAPKPGVNSDRRLTSGETAWMWSEIMKEVHSNLPVKNFDKPSGIVTASVCKDSGKIATDLCAQDQRGSRVVTEIFIEGKVPTEYCDVHVKARVDILNNKLASEYCPPELVEERVFIKRPYAVDSSVLDSQYQLPTDTCDIHNQSNGGYNPAPGFGDDDDDDDDDYEDEDSPYPTPPITPTKKPATP